MISILDYGIGNITSIKRAFEKNGAEVQLTNDPDVLISSDGLVLPGVGAFSVAMNRLQEEGLIDVLKDFKNTDKPILGICLGMQMLFDGSYEFGEHEGLCFIPGYVKKINVDENIKLPNIGWNTLQKNSTSEWSNTILDKVSIESNFYFVHTYCAETTNKEDTLSYSDYFGMKYCSTVKRENIYGCQYHPEKSGDEGLKIIHNFINLTV